MACQEVLSGLKNGDFFEAWVFWLRASLKAFQDNLKGKESHFALRFRKGRTIIRLELNTALNRFSRLKVGGKLRQPIGL